MIHISMFTYLSYVSCLANLSFARVQASNDAMFSVVDSYLRGNDLN